MSKNNESKKYNLHSWSAQGKINPKKITKMEGIYFWDEDGKKYYDMSAQLVNSNLGHGNKAITDAICKQAQEMAYVQPSYEIDIRTQAAKDVVEYAGPGFEDGKVFFTNAGAESNENALKMVKAFTGRWKIFSSYKSYHGSTYGGSSLCGEPRRWAAEPGIPGFIHFDGPYPYRAPKEVEFKTEESKARFYLELLENQIQYEGPDMIAAIFLETVVGSNGALVPPKGYLKGVRELCDKYGIIMVSDEVLAGFHRTGPNFGFQQFDFIPDIVTFAKGSTCGYVPLGGVIVQKKIADFFETNKMFCGLTYSAHPLGCAAVVAAIDQYKALNVEDNVKKMGKVLGNILEGYKKDHACVGDVRYCGLLSGIELVKDKATKEPLVPFNNDKEGTMPKIIGMLTEKGFSTYSHENVVFVCPPLIITEEELTEAMKIMDEVLGEVDKMI